MSQLIVHGLWWIISTGYPWTDWRLSVKGNLKTRVDRLKNDCAYHNIYAAFILTRENAGTGVFLHHMHIAYCMYIYVHKTWCSFLLGRMLKILSTADHMSGKALFKYETVLTSLSKHPVSCPIFFSHRQTGKNRLAALGLVQRDRTGLKNSATEPPRIEP